MFKTVSVRFRSRENELQRRRRWSRRRKNDDNVERDRAGNEVYILVAVTSGFKSRKYFAAINYRIFERFKF